MLFQSLDKNILCFKYLSTTVTLLLILKHTCLITKMKSISQQGYQSTRITRNVSHDCVCRHSSTGDVIRRQNRISVYPGLATNREQNDGRILRALSPCSLSVWIYDHAEVQWDDVRKENSNWKVNVDNVAGNIVTKCLFKLVRFDVKINRWTVC